MQAKRRPMKVTSHNAMMQLSFGFNVGPSGFSVEQTTRYLSIPSTGHMAFEKVKLPVMRAARIDSGQEVEKACESFTKTVLLKYLKKVEEVFRQHYKD
jgi:hypothetical protein